MVGKTSSLYTNLQSPKHSMARCSSNSSNPVLLWHFFCAFHCSHPLYPSKSRRPVSSPPIRTALFKCPANQGARCRARAKFVAGPNINTCRFIRESWVKPMLLSLTLVKLLYLHLAVSNSLSLSLSLGARLLSSAMTSVSLDPSKYQPETLEQGLDTLNVCGGIVDAL